MSHYIVDILFLVFGAVTVIICAKRGFFLSLLKFCKMLLAVGAAYLWGKAFGGFLAEKFLSAPIRNWVFNKINGMYQSATSGFDPQSALESLPAFVQTEELKAKVASLEETGEALVNSITDTVAGTVTTAVSTVLGFVLVFVIAFLVLTVVYFIIKGLKDKIRLVGTLDSVLGALLGLVLVCVVLILVGSVIKIFFGDDPVYTESILVKFFGEFPLLNISKWLNGVIHPA